jgi:hypothetical protein
MTKQDAWTLEAVAKERAEILGFIKRYHSNVDILRSLVVQESPIGYLFQGASDTLTVLLEALENLEDKDPYIP